MEKAPSIAERVIKKIRKLLKKLVFLVGNVNWLSELPIEPKSTNILSTAR